MKTSKTLYQLLALGVISLALSACATTTTEDELTIVPTNSAENIPTLADGLKLEGNQSEAVSDDG